MVYVFAQTQRWKPEALQILQSSMKIQLMRISQNIKYLFIINRNVQLTPAVIKYRKASS